MGHREGAAVISTKLIAGFFVRFVMVFAVLMILWPGVGGTYGNAFCGAGSFLFARFGSDGLVRFQLLEPPNSEDDLEVILVNRHNDSEYTFAGSSRLQGYKPTAFLLSLILATPVSWKRRGRAALWGLLWINVYVAIKTAVFLLARFSEENALALYTPGPFAQGLLDYSEWLVVISFAAWLIVPLPIWALVTLRRDDWPSIFQPHECPQSGNLGKARP